ncbi:hypothetical protein JW935_24155 [candidate division KSB1 bacterium]|nr:hypothetical protein [candidate division KSB1 bacterium]
MNIFDHLHEYLSPKMPFLFRIWEPDHIAVVIGYSQQAEEQVRLDMCEKDHIPIIKRRGGGGAVVLSPGIICSTIAFKCRTSDSPYYYFERINNFTIHVLSENFCIKGLHKNGISDISINDRKVLGCSIFKSRDTYLYQGSLLVHPPVALYEKYLQHPSKQPDYRRNRRHSDFVASLWQHGYRNSTDQIGTVLTRFFARDLYDYLCILKS